MATHGLSEVIVVRVTRSHAHCYCSSFFDSDGIALWYNHRYYSIMCMSRALLYYVLKSGLVAAVVFNCCRDRPEYCCILLLLLACMV